MRSARVLPALLLLVAGLSARAAETPPPTPVQIEAWAKQLGDEEPTKREEAAQALAAAGLAAVEAVRRAAASDDAETSTRAKALLVELVDKPALAKRRDLVRMRDGGPKAEGLQVLRDTEAWKAWIATCTSEDLRKQLAAEKIDFDQEMVLVAAEGPARSHLAKHEAEEAGIKGIRAKADAWDVEVVVVSSDKQYGADQYPVYIVRLPRTEKRIEFRVIEKEYGG
ncbi:MAG: hypothetical protein L6R28_15975 [Planctomycetes bacterium]|nr:hypothetical protein [Planctomycetota bacterium]